MFKELATFRLVLVTGPQRSGTRICARMVEHDTGLRYVDEQEYGVHDERWFRALARSSQGTVIHAPAMLHLMPEVVTEDVAVLFMRRNHDQIAASQKRVVWGGEKEERAKYPPFPASPISHIKENFWSEHVGEIAHHYDIEYHELAEHPLWIAREERQWFSRHQTV